MTTAAPVAVEAPAAPSPPPAPAPSPAPETPPPPIAARQERLSRGDRIARATQAAAPAAEAQPAAEVATSSIPDPAAAIEAAPGEELTPAERKELHTERMRLFRLERETRDARRAHERELAEAQQLKKVLASRDPDAILSAAGLSTRELLDRELVRAMKEGAPADDPVQQTVDASEKRVTDRIAQLEAKAAQLAHQTAMESFVQTHLVPATSDPEKFEALQLFFPDARARGYQLAAARQEHFDACGEWMPIEDAAERLERYYDGKLVEGAATLSKTKRYGSRFAQSAPTAAVAKKPPPSPVGTARSAPKPKVAGASPSPERLSRRERLDAIVRKAR